MWVAEGPVHQAERHDEREEPEHTGEDRAHDGARNLSGCTRARTRQPSRETATTSPTMFSAVAASSPPGDECHQREDRECGDDEGQVGHRVLLDGVRILRPPEETPSPAGPGRPLTPPIRPGAPR